MRIHPDSRSRVPPARRRDAPALAFSTVNKQVCGTRFGMLTRTWFYRGINMPLRLFSLICFSPIKWSESSLWDRRWQRHISSELDPFLLRPVWMLLLQTEKFRRENCAQHPGVTQDQGSACWGPAVSIAQNSDQCSSMGNGWDSHVLHRDPSPPMQKSRKTPP